MTRTQSLLAFSVLTLAVVACQSGDSDPAPAAAESSATSAEPGAGVSYEPAYPADVSAEGLSEEDAAQQERSQPGHTHGDDEHSHDDGTTHSHGQGEHP